MHLTFLIIVFLLFAWLSLWLSKEAKNNNNIVDVFSFGMAFFVAISFLIMIIDEIIILFFV